MTHDIDPVEQGIEVKRLHGIDQTADFRGCDLWNHGFERWPGFGGYRPLDKAEVAWPDSAHFAREPGLLFEPREGGEAILPLVPKGVELSARAESATTTLDQHLKAALGEGTGKEESEQPGPAIGRTQKDRRSLTAAARRVVIGQQHDAIGHRHLEVTLDGDVVSFGRGELKRPAEETGQNAHRPVLRD